MTSQFVDFGGRGGEGRGCRGEEEGCCGKGNGGGWWWLVGGWWLVVIEIQPIMYQNTEWRWIPGKK